MTWQEILVLTLVAIGAAALSYHTRRQHYETEDFVRRAMREDED